MSWSVRLGSVVACVLMVVMSLFAASSPIFSAGFPRSPMVSAPMMQCS